jgi:hypothetical protein
VAVFLCGAGLLRADGQNSLPQWYYDLVTAYNFYVTGVQQTAFDPKTAVDTLKNANKYEELALSEGASTQAIPLAQAIGQALATAESAKTPATPAAPATDSPAPRTGQPRAIPATRLIARKG